MSEYRGTWTGSPTRTLAEYASALRYVDLPREVIDRAKLCILDSMGCGLFGAGLPWSAKLQRVVQQLQGGQQAKIWGTAFAGSAADAALCNGTSCHAFELDDIYDDAFLHPGAVVVPAAMAVAEMIGGVGGERFLEAVVAGYEVSGRIGRALGQSVVLRGFHGHGVNGTMAAAVAAGKVLSLNLEETVHCLGIAGSQAGGLMAAQEGAMVKRMHSGRAAQSGVLSALLAGGGFTGIENVLEADFGGYCHAFGGLEKVDEAVFCSDLHRRFLILEVGFKLYPAVAGSHCAIEAMEKLMAERPISPEDVRAIDVYTSTFTVKHCGWPYVGGRGVMEAQMSISHAIATVLLRGAITPEAYTDDAMVAPELLALTRRVRVFADSEIDSAGREMRHAARVVLHLRDGSSAAAFVPCRKGSARNPLRAGDLEQKFRGLSRGVVGEERSDELERSVANLERISDVREVAALLSTRGNVAEG